VKWLSLILAMLVPLGSWGIDGLSQLSGVKIIWGEYDLQENGAVIYGEGIKDNGLWQVFCVWKNGFPQMIVTKKLQDGI
jgi:hypothetical protein